MAYSFKQQILDQHGQKFYKHNAEAPRNENRNTMNMQSQIFESKRSHIIKTLEIKPDIGTTHK